MCKTCALICFDGWAERTREAWGERFGSKMFPPQGGGFRVLPATKACLQGFREFLRCYRGATGVLPVLPGATKAGTMLRLVQDPARRVGVRVAKRSRGPIARLNSTSGKV